MFLAFAIVPLIGFAGIATDTARAYLVKSRLSSAPRTRCSSPTIRRCPCWRRRRPAGKAPCTAGSWTTASPPTTAIPCTAPVNLPAADGVAWQPVGPEGEPVPGFAGCALAIGFIECAPTLSHGITPLQNQKQVILDAVNALASPRGVTNIPGGLGWAWRVLKPPAPFTEALPDPEYDREQAIVLLTDGENYGGSGDGYKGTFGLGGTARPDMNDRLPQVADTIRADGALVYVVQFAFAEAAPQTLPRTVASGPGSP